MAEDIPVEACPDCGRADSRDLYRDSKYSFRECAGCLSIYCSPRTVLEFDDAYSEGYYRASYLPREQETISYYGREIMPLVRKHLQPGGRILDIGCGTGFFLKAAMDSGYRVVGVEPSAFASEYCRSHWGMECHSGFFEDLSLGGFDLIVLMNVFTQLTTDKKILLGKIRESLNPGGKILIKTICWNRAYPIVCGMLPNEALQRLCLHIPLQHYIYHDRNIGPCLEGSGFTVSAIEKCAGEWSLLRGMAFGRIRLSAAIAIKWLLLKSLCGPVKTDMLVVAAKDRTAPESG
ncbi:MAG: SAM-dependent methyltransferase [Fibrobacteres bacterium]|nr:SAM-dependent methyltransferase [Fibrobacterota bacterium]